MVGAGSYITGNVEDTTASGGTTAGISRPHGVVGGKPVLKLPTTAYFPWSGTPLRLSNSSCKHVHAHTSGDLEGKGARVDVEHRFSGQSPSPLAHERKGVIASNLLGEDQRVSLSGSDLSLGGTPTLGHSYGVVGPEGNTLERTRPEHSGIPLPSGTNSRDNSPEDDGIAIAGRSSPVVARPTFRGVAPSTATHDRPSRTWKCV